ncbi:phospholipase D-like domain-containing protein [Anaerolineales bacterium]
MTKKSTKASSSSRSPFAAIIAVLIIGLAALVFSLTGTDFLGIFPAGTLTPSVTPSPPPTSIQITTTPGLVSTLEVGQGYGAQKSPWEVYFTAPSGSSTRSTYVGGISENLASAIDQVQSTLDIAAFEMNNKAITAAILRAHDRGVAIRVVTDNEHGIEDDETTLIDLEDVGIKIVDDKRSALMHNKFMIMDGQTVWLGSMNYTENGTYRNNNHMIKISGSPELVAAYQAEFNGMFLNNVFGPKKPSVNGTSFAVDGISGEVWFAPQDSVMQAVIDAVNSAQTSIRFMVFVMSDDDLATAIKGRHNAGVDVKGIYENRNSTAVWSTMTDLLCAKIDVRQDTNPYTLHHKVIIIDNQIVVTGSFNFSANAAKVNDENLLMINDPDLAAQFIAEFDRLYLTSRVPEGISCK